MSTHRQPPPGSGAATRGGQRTGRVVRAGVGQFRRAGGSGPSARNVRAGDLRLGAGAPSLLGHLGRKGGISTAIEARVDETILYLQSGHGAALQARPYMQIASPARFLETFEAFGL